VDERHGICVAVGGTLDQRSAALQQGDHTMSAPPYAPPQYAPPQYAPPQHIVITDIHIPFWRLVGIFVKWALAAIPATIIVVIIFMIVGFVIAAILASLGMNIKPPMGGVIP
jgi:hypothetical protein